jgi:hypothetical protein
MSSPLRSPWDFDRQNGRQMEWKYFRSFQYFLPEIQSCDVEHNGIPDFRLFADRVIGVELTRLFKPEARQDLESTQERILEEVCQLAQERQVPDAHVALFFNLSGPLRHAARSQIAHAVVRVVAEQMPAEGELLRIERALGQPREVDLITVSRRSPPRWSWLECAKIEGDVVCVVQQAIDGKANKLSSYLKFCSECWLLLVADSFRSSANLPFANSCQSHVFRSPFARTYVLDFGKGNLYSLTTLE